MLMCNPQPVRLTLAFRQIAQAQMEERAVIEGYRTSGKREMLLAGLEVRVLRGVRVQTDVIRILF